MSQTVFFSFSFLACQSIEINYNWVKFLSFHTNKTIVFINYYKRLNARHNCFIQYKTYRFLIFIIFCTTLKYSVIVKSCTFIDNSACLLNGNPRYSFFVILSFIGYIFKSTEFRQSSNVPSYYFYHHVVFTPVPKEFFIYIIIVLKLGLKIHNLEHFLKSGYWPDVRSLKLEGLA